MKILISGGHLTPALAVIDYIQDQHPETKIIFVGRKFSQDKLKQPSNEAQEVKKREVPFVTLNAPRMSHDLPLNLVLRLPAFILATCSAINILLTQKPTVFLSFGGYLALPLALACYLLRIPIVTHEQTKAAGLANQIIGKLAQKVAISHSSSGRYFQAKKTILTGNPLRAALFKTQKRPNWLPTAPNKPLLYITGGNQGSEIINSITQQALRPLLSQWFVVHQCGNPTSQRNYKAELEQSFQRLSATLRGSYIVREWVNENELAWLYQHASVVISRAGANTVAELIAHHLPAILIPLPFARHDEQALNAQYMADLGGAEVLPQKELNSVTLLKKLAVVKKYHSTMKQHLSDTQTPADAAAKLYQVLIDVTN